MTDSELRISYAALMYFVREQYWGHGEEVCNIIIKRSEDNLFRVWRALCQFKQGGTSEALRELKTLENNFQTKQNHKYVYIPALQALYLLYKANQDKEAMLAIELKLEKEKNQLQDDPTHNAAEFDELGNNIYNNMANGWMDAAGILYAVGDVNSAREILLLFNDAYTQKHKNSYTNLSTWRGWVDLATGRGALVEKSGAAFQWTLNVEKNRHSDITGNTGVDLSEFTKESTSSAKNTDVNAALGRVAYLEKKFQLAPAQELLNKVIVQHPQFTPALIIKSRLMMRAEDWTQSLETARRVLSSFKAGTGAGGAASNVNAANFSPITSTCNNMLEALIMETLYYMVRENRPSAAVFNLNKLLELTLKQEPRNPNLFFQIARCFSRLGGNSLQLLNVCTKFAEQATMIAQNYFPQYLSSGPNHLVHIGEYWCEVGNQQLLKADYKTALLTFKKASTLTDTLSPLLGTITAYLRLNKLEDANRNLILCNELQSVNERHAQLSLLNAQIAWRVKKDEKKTLMHLDNAAEAIRHELNNPNGVAAKTGGAMLSSLLLNYNNSGLHFFIHLNPALVIETVREYMQHARNEPPDPSFRVPDANAEKCKKMLQPLLQNAPGCMEAQLLLAKIYYISGEMHPCQKIIKLCLAQEEVMAEVYLVSAQVCMYTNNVKLAKQSLEQALTIDFELKDQPFYNLLQGIVLGQSNQPKKALESLETCLKITNNYNEGLQKLQMADKTPATPSKSPTKGGSSPSSTAAPEGAVNVSGNSNATDTTNVLTTSTGQPVKPLSLPDQVTLYLQIAQTHLRLHDADEAKTVLNKCNVLFLNTNQHGRVQIAQAMLTARTNIDKAIEILKNVNQKSPFYVPARSQLAKMYLMHKFDYDKYAQCFEEMVEQVPTPQSYLELGEAYTTIQEPEKAIAAYEKARMLLASGNSGSNVSSGGGAHGQNLSSDLSVRIGRALVSTHDYEKAVRYYNEAIVTEELLFNVRADLAMLYLHLGNGQRSVATLKGAPQFVRKADKEEEVNFSIERVNCCLLLYKVMRRMITNGAVGKNAKKNGGAHKKRKGDEEDKDDEDEDHKPGELEDGKTPLQEAGEVLRKAKAAQQFVLEYQLRSESRETLLQQKSIMATIHTELAHFLLLQAQAEGEGDNTVTEVKTLLEDALKFDEAHEEALTELAKFYLTHEHDCDKCEELCNQALRLNPQSDEATMLLADAVLARGKVEDAAIYFQQMLDTQSLLAARALKKSSSSSSSSAPSPPAPTQHAVKFASQYEAMIKYIELLRRVGRLEEAEALLEKADQTWAAAQPGGHQREPNPGLSFVHALYLKYTNHKVEALRHFSQARTPSSLDNPYYLRSLIHMIGIYLLPTSEDLWVKDTAEGDGQVVKTRNDNLRSAEKLLLQLPHGEARQVLLGFIMLAGKERSKAESAMQVFLSIIDLYNSGMPITSAEGDAAVAAAATTATSPQKKAGGKRRGPRGSDDDEEDTSEDEDAELLRGAAELEAQSAAKRGATLAAAMNATKIHKSSFLGLAIALYMLEQEQAAKNIIEKLVQETEGLEASVGSSGEVTGPAAGKGHAVLEFTEQDVVERALLLDVHMDIEGNRLDDAKKTLHKILDRNQSCSSAWDSLGMLHERQKQYKESAECYQKAWQLLQENDPNIGYRLALNHLKAGEAVKAIDVSRTVLEKDCNYPKIEEEVTEIAYGMLRP